MESRQVRATLAARAKLVDIRRDIENQMRELLESLGIVLGKAGARTIPEQDRRNATPNATFAAADRTPVVGPLRSDHANPQI
jgi:transposase